MKLAFSKPTEKEHEQKHLFETFGTVGFDGLQLKYGQYSGYLGDPERFLETWPKPGTASALIAGGSLDETGKSNLRKLFAFAEAVGSERIVFCHGLSRQGITPDDLKRFAHTLSDLGFEAQQRGVTLSLHHHYDQPVMYQQDLEIFFESTTDDTVKLTIDTAHLIKSGIHDIAGIIRNYKHVIDNFHFKDIENDAWQVLGNGVIDFDPVFEAINGIGYDGWLSADEESGMDLSEAMHCCYRYLTSHVNS